VQVKVKDALTGIGAAVGDDAKPAGVKASGTGRMGGHQE
jgi:hypothetical protein